MQIATLQRERSTRTYAFTRISFGHSLYLASCWWLAGAPLLLSVPPADDHDT